MKLSVSSEALVMPSRIGSASAGLPPASSMRLFSARNVARSTCSPQKFSVSPGSVIRTLRSIWRMMISMCLSLIVTPCRR